MKHKIFGAITNTTEKDPESGRRERLTGSNNRVIDAKCEDDQQRVLLLDVKYWEVK